ncbi:MAG: phosphopantetheine-binding protein [Deltaproteobacteria bacterium]|jgi:acyl carrier protein|nr:phosphopantetheine-binding protein [Deltaproteobacteria bacterium]
MTDEQIIAAANKALAEEFELDPDTMRPEMRFKEDFNLDSLDAVDMVVVLEKTFKIKIGRDPAILLIRTVGDMHDYIIAKKRQLEQT